MNSEQVTYNLLTHNNIKKTDILKILNYLVNYKLDYADLYFQDVVKEYWYLENKKIKEGLSCINKGIGTRTIKGEQIGFSYSDQINLPELKKSAHMACTTLAESNKQKNIEIKYFNENINKRYISDNFLQEITSKKKIDLLYEIDNFARNIDNRVKEVKISLSGQFEQILIASTDNTFSYDVRPSINFSITVIVEDNGNIEQGRSGGGAQSSYNFLFKKNKKNISNVKKWTKEAVRIAILNLSSKQAPSGSLPVVLGPGWPGVLLHEAVGHGLEGDFNRLNTSIFSNKIGCKVASNLCTIVDDGTLYEKKGSLNIDDEGIQGQYNILIKKGVLVKYMQDKNNARLVGKISTGNGRRQSYAHLPMPRMTNTYMLPGSSQPQDIINSIDYGLYAVNFSGGQVDITSGSFAFSTAEAYLVKNGVILYPVKNATLIGSGLEVMNNITMVGNDLKIDNGMGVCVKNGQSVPVCVGQPTLKINKITVGGTHIK
ncbi:metalloprotease TldD [Buchnera aphidicola (Taiwanaphis decaspermi)]|uniref:metalloprotease TldD n=1 Tax=Buchnera aphidicola TaxID=9 RepID=UPI0031B7F2EC